MRVIRAPANDVLVFARIVVDGEADFSTVARLQDQFGIETLATSGTPAAWKEAPSRGEGPAAFVDMANTMLGRNPPPSYEAQLLTRFAEVGIDGKRRWVTLPAELQAIWQAAWPALHKGLAAPPEDAEQTSNGWHYSSARAGNFGTDYGLRARIALRGLLALESVEACYAGTAVDEGGQPLSGAHRYRLRLAPGNLPVNAFWSLSMYAREPDGRSYFVANPIERYAIGDRTAGLIMGDDGTIDIWIQQDAPLEPARRANWLPAPAGAFRVTLRAYEPRAEFRDGRVRLPALERQD